MTYVLLDASSSPSAHRIDVITDQSVDSTDDGVVSIGESRAAHTTELEGKGFVIPAACDVCLPQRRFLTRLGS